MEALDLAVMVWPSLAVWRMIVTRGQGHLLDLSGN